MLLCVLPLVLTQATTSPEAIGAAGLHPREAELYLELGPAEDLRAAYAKAPLVDLLREPAVAAVTSAFGVEGGWLDALGLARPLIELVRSSEARVSLSLSRDTEGRAGVLVALEESSEERATALARSLEELGTSVSEAKGSLVEPRIVTCGSPPSEVWIARAGTRVFVGGGGTRAAEVASRLTEPTATFAADERLAEGRARLAADGAGTDVLWLASKGHMLSSLLDLARELGLFTADVALDLPPGLVPFADPLVSRVRLDAQGFVTDTLRFEAKPPATLDRSMLDTLPDGSLLAYATTFDDTLFETLAASTTGLGLEGDLPRELEKALAALSDTLGGSVNLSVDPVSGLGLPKGVARFELASEPERRASAASTLDELVLALGRAYPELSSRTRDYRVKRADGERVAFAITTLTLPEDSTLAGPYGTPSFCIADGVLLVATSSLDVKTELKRLYGERGDDAPGLLSRLGVDTSDVGSVLVIDWPSQVRAVFDAVQMLGAFVELPFDVADLPEADVVTRYLGPTVRTSRASGEVAHIRSRSAFGPETLLLVGALASNLAGSFSDSAFESSGEAPPEER